MGTTRVGFSTSKGPLSAVIRRVMRSPSSHAFLIYYDEDLGTDMVLEAVGEGFHLITLERVKKTSTVVEVIDLKRSLNQGLAFLAGWLGTRYDTAGLLGMGWVLAGRAIRRRWRNPFGSSKSMFCSEAITRALKADGFPGVDGLDPEATSPADLMAFLKARL